SRGSFPPTPPARAARTRSPAATAPGARPRPRRWPCCRSDATSGGRRAGTRRWPRAAPRTAGRSPVGVGPPAWGRRLGRTGATVKPGAATPPAGRSIHLPFTWRKDVRAPCRERSIPFGGPRRCPNGPPAAVPPPMGVCHDGPHDRNPGAQGRAAGRDPGSQLPATRDPGRGGRGRGLAADGATRQRARCAAARHLRRAFHGRDGCHRQPRQARAHPRPGCRVLARGHDRAARRARAALGPADVEAKRREYPDAEFLVHPECGCVTGTMYYAAADGDVAAGRTHIVSTEAMTRRARTSPARRFVVATETGVLYRLRRE